VGLSNAKRAAGAVAMIEDENIEHVRKLAAGGHILKTS